MFDLEPAQTLLVLMIATFIFGASRLSEVTNWVSRSFSQKPRQPTKTKGKSSSLTS